MKTVDELYPPRFFKGRSSLNWRAPIVVDAVMDIFEPPPESMIDVGCATGDIVAEFGRRGVDAFGLEGTKNVFEFLEISQMKMMFWDLRCPIIVEEPREFDLAICLEVAEHIEPEFADVFLENLTHFSRRILMSAAHPGQGGINHFNCQPPEYWIEKMDTLGFDRIIHVEDIFRSKWEPWKNKKGIKAYYDNVLYFEARQ